MQPHTTIGHNRTGLRAAPPSLATYRMDDPAGAADGETAERADQSLRVDYASSAESLGSMPPPSTLTGAVKSGVDMLSGKRPQVLLDKLGERLAFERGGVRLYDALLVKCAGAAESGAGLEPDEVELLQEYRRQEAEHALLLVEQLRHLGADPTVQTPSADLVGMESAGLVQALNDPRTTLPQALHVMLDAELIDNASWEMLIELAHGAGHTQVAHGLEAARSQEAEHLQTLRMLAARMTLEDAGASASASAMPPETV